MSDQDDSIRKVVIVGGGSSGWMAAAAMTSFFGRMCEVCLIESDAIGTVGVGEATTISIRRFNKALGINEPDFFRQTQGSVKMGIQFQNWAEKGDAYFQAFGGFGFDKDREIPFQNKWIKAYNEGKAGSLDDYCMSWLVAKRNKFIQPDRTGKDPFRRFDYAYHFDAGLYGKFLRKISEKRGVKRIEGKIDQVKLRPEDGFVDKLVLESGEEVDGDFFIDCSGFRSLLLGDALGVKFHDWSHWLPCDSAVAVQCEFGTDDDFTPYTKSIAHEAGWQWRIPLQNRIGNGHVYCSKYMGDEEAREILMNNLDGRPITDPKVIKFTAGRRDKFWSKNVLAIGLSSGFLEPLESTSLHLVATALFRLMNLFPSRDFDPVYENEYNDEAIQEFEHIRDFIILHYKLNQRGDSEFWKYCESMDIPDSLRHRIDLFHATGKITPRHGDLFQNNNWLSVFVGQKNIPKRFSALYKTAADLEAFDEKLLEMRRKMEMAAEKMPSHRGFIDHIKKKKTA